MSENTKIEWADHTFNPWIGCTKVSPGCDNCYAAAWDRRFAVSGHAMHWGAGQPRRRTKTWAAPLKWNKQPFYSCGCGWRGSDLDVQHIGAGLSACPACDRLDVKPARARVFCASLADVFDNEVPVSWRINLLELIAKTPNLDWLLLTKRIGNAHAMLNEAVRNLVGGHPTWWSAKAWPHIWIGATIVNQEEADRDIPKLLAVPAAKRFLSMEPLLGPVDIRKYLNEVWCEDCDWAGDGCAGPNDGDSECPECGGVVHFRCGTRIDWVIVGGESGPGARPMHPDWARSLRDQCQAAGVPFLFKQWGEWTSGENVERQRGVIPIASLWNDIWQVSDVNLYTDHGHIDDEPDLYRVGKKAAGRFLDGRTWDEVPK